MSLVHELILMKDEDRIDKIGIPDDIIQYIYDSTQWIVSLWSGNRLEYGLPYYGEALLKSEGIDKLKNICQTWRSLFELAPDEVILTGNYLFDEMKREELKYSKEELIAIFDKIVSMCQVAEELDLDILYEGI